MEVYVALSVEDLYDKAVSLVPDQDKNFLDLGKTLRQLLDREPELFHKVVEESNIKRRKAYYLVEISRAFEPLKTSRARLQRLGWTKCQLIDRHVNQDNVEELVELAEGISSKQLERQMKGEKPINNARCVLMYFSPREYKELEQALLLNGGVSAEGGRTIRNKEKALMNIIRKVLPFKIDHDRGHVIQEPALVHE